MCHSGTPPGAAFQRCSNGKSPYTCILVEFFCIFVFTIVFIDFFTSQIKYSSTWTCTGRLLDFQTMFSRFSDPGPSHPVALSASVLAMAISTLGAVDDAMLSPFVAF